MKFQDPTICYYLPVILFDVLLFLISGRFLLCQHVVFGGVCAKSRVYACDEFHFA